jgi:hypothetical protein
MCLQVQILYHIHVTLQVTSPRQNETLAFFLRQQRILKDAKNDERHSATIKTYDIKTSIVCYPSFNDWQAHITH